MNLTPGQTRALEVLNAADKPLAPRQVAQRLWPDSPAWAKRTRRYGANRNGAVGGTMPMLAAKLLHALQDKGMARITDDGYRWEAVK